MLTTTDLLGVGSGSYFGDFGMRVGHIALKAFDRADTWVSSPRRLACAALNLFILPLRCWKWPWIAFRSSIKKLFRSAFSFTFCAIWAPTNGQPAPNANILGWSKKKWSTLANDEEEHGVVGCGERQTMNMRNYRGGGGRTFDFFENRNAATRCGVGGPWIVWSTLFQITPFPEISKAVSRDTCCTLSLGRRSQ